MRNYFEDANWNELDKDGCTGNRPESEHQKNY